MRISRLAINNYQFTLIVILLLIISGISSFLMMPRSEDPQVAPNGTSIIAIYPGTSPADMEELVADPLEGKLNELDNIKRIESLCQDNLAVVSVEFHSGIDMDETYAKLVQKVNSIRSELPEGITDFRINRWNISDFVIVFQAALVSESAEYSLLEKEADRLEKLIEKVYGVKKVKKWALPDQEVRVSLNVEKMYLNHISIDQISKAIESSNFNLPGGHLDIGGKRMTVNTSGSYRSLDEIKNTIVYAFGEKIVYLKDIADITFDYEDTLTMARFNGQRAVFITINQKEGTNIFSVMKEVRDELNVFQENLSPSISLYTVFDQSRSVSRNLKKFFRNLLQGLILVGLVVFLAVSLRASIIVILAIPISFLISIGFVDMTGIGIQQMTIAGLVISLGLLVDNAIVVTENISRFIKQGQPPIQAAVEGTAQIGGAIISSTATTVLAFLPIAMMGYTTGEYIRSMPLTVIYTLAASLFVALTLTPFLCSRFLRYRIGHKETPARKLLDLLITKTYRPTLAQALNHPRMTIILVLVVFGLSLFLFQFVGISFFPKAEKPQLVININTPEGSNLNKTDRAARYVESVLTKRPEVIKYGSSIGQGYPQIHYSIDSKEATISHAQIFVELNTSDIPAVTRLIRELRNSFKGYPGAEIEIKELEQGPPVEAPIAIKIQGKNLETLRNISLEVERFFHTTPGTVNIVNPYKLSKTDLKININRAKAGMLGIPIIEIDRTIRACIAGLPASKYRDIDGKEYDIVIRLPVEDKLSIEDLDRIYVTSLTGTSIPLRQIAELEFRSSPKQIDHFNFDRTITITADVERGYSVDKTTREIMSKLDDYNWPKGYGYYVAGQLESQAESFGGMGRAVLIAMIAIFAVLVLQFRSFSQPLIVFTAIPLALIGSILGLLITGYSFSFTAFIGLTSLVGIVVNNSIILVDYTNKLRDKGKEMIEALKEAGETRFIPIVLTTATTIGGLLPLTLRGGTLWGPMGWTIIGGLMVSTFLTLIVVPILYKAYSHN